MILQTLRIKLLCAFMDFFKANQIQNIEGIELVIKKHQTNPMPFTFLPQASFLGLFKKAVDFISSGNEVLEMGAGCGLWGLLCLKKGAQVSFSDLTDVDLSSILESAQRNHFPLPELYQGDLFADSRLQGKRFDHILFNPPFHLGSPKNIAEQAYLGGENGSVLLRFFEQVPDYLHAQSKVYLILPKIEYQFFQSKIKEGFHINTIAKQWVPLLGTCLLLQLRCKEKLESSIQSNHTQKLSVSAESFYHLSKLINTHSCELLQLKGKIDDQRLKKSIYQCCLKHPITRSKLKNLGIWQGYAWEIDPLFHIDLIDFQTQFLEIAPFDVSADRIPSMILDEIWSKTAIDPFTQYPIQFRLIHTPTYSYFLVIAPHLCTDARAGILVAHQIIDFYQKNHHEPMIAQNFLNDQSPLALTHLPKVQKLKLATLAVLGILKDLLISAQGLGLAKDKRGKTQIHSILIDESKLNELKQQSKNQNTTLHQILMLSFIQAQKTWKQQYQIKQSQRIRLADLYNLSNEYPLKDQLNQSFNILVTPYTLTLNVHQDQAFIRHDFAQKLKALKNGLGLVELYRLMIYNMLARILPISLIQKLMDDVLKTETTTTNPGVIPYTFQWENQEIEVVDLINFLQISPPAKLALIYSTFRKRLRLIFLYDDLTLTDAQIQSLQHSFLNELNIKDQSHQSV